MPKTDVLTRPGGPPVAAPGGHLVPGVPGAAGHGTDPRTARRPGARHARVDVTGAAA
jgi:hypothetical protein